MIIKFDNQLGIEQKYNGLERELIEKQQIST